MRRLLRVLSTALTLGLSAGLASAAPLIEPADLAAKSGAAQVRIIDIRDGKDASGRTPFDTGHVPGSVSAPYSQWRGPADNPGKLPDAQKLSELLQRLGIDSDTEVVVVYEGKDATDFGAAARVYWTLKTAGLSRLSILNGGLKAWRAAGKPISTEAAQVKPSSYVAKIDPAKIATREEVERIVAGREKAALIDARPAPFFEGDRKHAAAKAAGTIKGATSIAHDHWFAKDNAALLPSGEIRKIAQQVGLQQESAGETVSFCNTGHWAATNWFVMSEVLGKNNVKLYPESMVEWSQAGLPMDNVPGRLKQLLGAMKQ